MESLPKSDIHCRFSGSVTVRFVWDELHAMAEHDAAKFGALLAQHKLPADTTFDTFRAALQKETHTVESLARGKALFRMCLQSEDQIKRGVENILRYAAEQDGVTYMELVVRPCAHTKGGLSEEQVVRLIDGEVQRLQGELHIRVNLMLYASLTDDDPVQFHETAKLTVRMRDEGMPVVGFGAFGESEMNEATAPFYKTAFEYLKVHNMKVAASAGIRNSNSIVTALCSGATRISGGFKVHDFPLLAQYLSTHNIPLEISPSTRMKSSTQEMRSFLQSSPIRFYMDSQIPVSLASFNFGLRNLKKKSDSIFISRFRFLTF